MTTAPTICFTIFLKRRKENELLADAMNVVFLPQHVNVDMLRNKTRYVAVDPLLYHELQKFKRWR